MSISVTAAVLSIKQFLSDVLMQDVSSFQLDAGSLDNYKSFNTEVRGGAMYTDVEYLNQLLATFRSYREIFIRNLFLTSLFNEIVIRVTEVLSEDVFLANQFRECLIFQEPAEYTQVEVIVNKFLSNDNNSEGLSYFKVAMDAIKNQDFEGLVNAVNSDKAIIEYTDDFNGSLLFKAVKESPYGSDYDWDFRFVEYLIEAGSDVNVRLPFGFEQSILFLPITNIDMVRLLVEAGADIDVVMGGSRAGQTVLDSAYGLQAELRRWSPNEKLEGVIQEVIDYLEGMGANRGRVTSNVVNALFSGCDYKKKDRAKVGKVGKGQVDKVNKKAKSGRGINVEGADLENHIVLNSKNQLGVVRTLKNNSILLDMGNGQYSIESSKSIDKINIIPKFNAKEMLLRSALSSKNWRSELSKIGIRSSRLVRYMDSIVSKGSKVSASQSVYIKSLRERALVKLESKWFDSYKKGENTVEVFKNPTKQEYLDLERSSKENSVRGLYLDGSIYIWDAYIATHFDVIQEFNFDLGGTHFELEHRKLMITEVEDEDAVLEDFYFLHDVAILIDLLGRNFDIIGSGSLFIGGSKNIFSMVVDDVYPETAFQDILEANFGDRGTVSFDEMAPATEGDVTEWRDLFTVVFTDVTTGLKGMLFFEFFEKVKGRHEEVVDWGVDSISFDVVGDGESDEYAVEFGNANIDSKNFDRDLVDGIRVSFTNAVIGMEDKFSADLQEQLFNVANAYAAVRGTDKVQDVLEDIIWELRLTRVTWQELEEYFESLIKQGEGIAASIYKSNPDSVVFWSSKGLMCSVGGRVRLVSDWFDSFNNRRGETVEVFKNSSKNEFLKLYRLSKFDRVRGVYSEDSGNVYLWVSELATHFEVFFELGLHAEDGVHFELDLDSLYITALPGIEMSISDFDFLRDVEVLTNILGRDFKIVDGGGFFEVENSINQAESKQGAMIKEGQYLSYQFNVPFDIEIDGENISYQQFQALILTADIDLNAYLQEKLFNNVFISNLLKFFGSAVSATPMLSVLPYYTQSADSEYAGVIEVVVTIWLKVYKSYTDDLTAWIKKYRFDMYKKRFSFGDSSFIFHKEGAWVDELPTVVRDGMGTFVEIGYSPDYYSAVIEQAIDKEKAYSKVEGYEDVILIDSQDIYNTILPILEAEGGIDRESILSVDVDTYGSLLLMELSDVAVDSIEQNMVYLYDSIAVAAGMRVSNKVSNSVDPEGVLSRAGNMLTLGFSSGADTVVVFSDKYKYLKNPTMQDLMLSGKRVSLKSMFLNTVLLDEVDNGDGVLRLDLGSGFELIPVGCQKWANFKGYFDVSGSRDLYFDLIAVYDYLTSTEGIDLTMYASDFVIESVEDFESFLCNKINL